MIYGVNTTVAETNDNDEEMILSLINEKLNCDYVDYEYLYDFSLNNRYVLITGDNCYLIYDYFLHDYVEFSCSGVSIYNDINGEYIKIYFLPTYYFYYYNSKFYEIRGNRQLTENEVLSFKDNEEEISRAIDEILQFNVNGIYKKISKDNN